MRLMPSLVVLGLMVKRFGVLLVVATLVVALGWGILELTTFRIQSSSISKRLIFLTMSCKIIEGILDTVSTAIIAAAIRTKPSDKPSSKLSSMPSLQPLLQPSSELPTQSLARNQAASHLQSHPRRCIYSHRCSHQQKLR
jgi:hypothetical protein